ncbi:MAG: hypothetical protein ACLP7J_03345, partial [Streptosporangiaceae bacterium]
MHDEQAAPDQAGACPADQEPPPGKRKPAAAAAGTGGPAAPRENRTPGKSAAPRNQPGERADEAERLRGIA